MGNPAINSRDLDLLVVRPPLPALEAIDVSDLAFTKFGCSERIKVWRLPAKIFYKFAD